MSQYAGLKRLFGAWWIAAAVWANEGNLELQRMPLPEPMRALSLVQYRVVATGGHPPYQFRVSAGKLPAGLELRTDLNPVIVDGLPYEEDEGPYDFTITVRDARGATASQRYQGNVVNTLVLTPRVMTFLGRSPGQEYTVMAHTSEPEGTIRLNSPLLIVTPAQGNRVVSSQARINWMELDPNACRITGDLNATSGDQRRTSDVIWNISSPCSGFAGPANFAAADWSVANSVQVNPELQFNRHHWELHALRDGGSEDLPVKVKAQQNGVRYAVLADVAWLRIDAPQGTMDGVKQLRLTADPKGLPEGKHQGVVTIFNAAGQEMDHLQVLLRVKERKLPVLLSSRSLVLTAEKRSETLLLRNRNRQAVSFVAQSASQQFEVNPKEGLIAAESEITLTVTGSAELDSAAASGDLLLALQNTQLEMVQMQYRPVGCASDEVRLEAEQPGRVIAIHTAGVVQFRIAAQDGCGKKLDSGVMSLKAMDGAEVRLSPEGDGSWVGSWQDVTRRHRVEMFEAEWKALSSVQTAKLKIQVNVD